MCKHTHTCILIPSHRHTFTGWRGTSVLHQSFGDRQDPSAGGGGDDRGGPGAGMVRGQTPRILWALQGEYRWQATGSGRGWMCCKSLTAITRAELVYMSEIYSVAYFDCIRALKVLYL